MLFIHHKTTDFAMSFLSNHYHTEKAVFLTGCELRKSLWIVASDTKNVNKNESGILIIIWH